MSITHEEAHRLIQLNADETLRGLEKNLLAIHLETCAECRRYADSIQELESVLLPIMQRRWSRSPLPLPRQVIRSTSSQFIYNMILATRILAVSVICIAFSFNVWQFTRAAGQPPKRSLAISMPAPTPSLPSTSTQEMEQDCAHLYFVQKGDTLMSIASQFFVPRQEIIRDNNLKSDSLYPSMKLVISTCNSTPESVTTAYTPWSNPITSTPTGSLTQ